MSQPQEEPAYYASECISKKYREILKSNGINEEIEEVTVADAGLKGEGMASQTQYVTIKLKNTNMKPLNLFVKVHTSNPQHSEWIEEWKLFEKESRFFMEYVPAAKEFCKSKGREGLIDFYPKCYYGDQTMVVLENLVLEKGYVLLNKEVKQDLEATRLAIVNLAKHHAISYAFIKELGGAEKFFDRFPNLNFEPFLQESARVMMEPMLDNGLSTNITILEKNNVEGKDEAVEKLKSHLGNPFSLMQDVLKYNPEDERLLVLNHGDYWNNNSLFLKDSANDKAIGHVAIDLQMVNYNSPATDISYYLYTSVKEEVRQANLQELLKLYFDTLKETAQNLDHTLDLTFGEFYAIYLKKLKFGFWFGFCVATDAGLAIMKDLDINEMGELKDYASQSEKLIQKWIEENPEKGLESARKIVGLVNEYYSLIEA
ncbi:unnamed protein product [Orchesella dallaii]|uniref:CHK kinase-like domain-containing protein n=1 Tax=Orchesella dallaii TaxID=48710 RepID=A0ABP1R9J6_9HEXA